MGGCPIKLLPDHLANQCFIQRLAAFGKVLSQSIVNHCLIPRSSFCRPITKFFNYLIIKINRNPGLALLGHHRASFCSFEFIFLLHSISSPRTLLSSQKSIELSRPGTYKPPRRSSRLNRYRLLRIFFLHRYLDPLSLKPSDRKARSQHPRNESYVSANCFWPFWGPKRCPWNENTYNICICQA